MIRKMTLLTSLVTLCLLMSCTAQNYRYHVLSFTKSASKSMATGIANPEACKSLFEPAVYLGPVIDIPDDAVIWGTLIVTRENDLKAIPLYSWENRKGEKLFGCNGPSPAFALQAKTPAELAEMIAKRLGEKKKQD